MKDHGDNDAPLLSVRKLNVCFKVRDASIHAVKDVDLDLRKGEILAIVGESGSGKSVTAQAIISLLPAHAQVNYDAISFRQQQIDTFTPAQLRSYRGGSIGMVFQEPSSSFDPLYPIGKTLIETILAHSDVKIAEARQKCMHLLHEIGIQNAAQRINNYPHQFSGGQLQRINLALAIAADPAILIADEPTTALDVTIQAEIIALLKGIIHARGLSVIFISHDIALVASIADRIAVMYNGYILEIGDVQQIINEPHHPYSAALLNSAINLGVHYRTDTLKTIPGIPPSPFEKTDGCPFAPRCEYVLPECRHTLLDMRTAEKRAHRCLIPGSKRAT